MPRPGRWQGKAVRFGRLDRLSQLVLVAANEALQSAPPLGAAERGGIVLGTAYGSHLTNELFWRDVLEGGTIAASPSLFTYTLPSAAIGELSIQLDLKGPSLALAVGLSAGLAALAEGARLVESGALDWVLAGAADTLSSTLLLAQEDKTTPLAESAAFFTLGRDGDRATPRIGGAGQASGALALERATALALDQAGLKKAEVKEWLGYDRSSRLSVMMNQFMSGGPLVALGAMLQRQAPADSLRGGASTVPDQESALPLLVASHDGTGLVVVLCIIES
jgi:hypothetical protein